MFSAASIRSTVGDPKTNTVAKGDVTRDIIAAPQGDGREIVAAEFFAPDALPTNLAEQLQRNLADWIRTAKAGSPA